MESILIRTIYNGDISHPIDFEYDKEGQMEGVYNKIKANFGKNVAHLIQVGRVLAHGDLAKDAIGPAGYLFALLRD